MMEAVLSKPAVGIIVSIATYALAARLRERTRSPLMNPLIVATALIILIFYTTPLEMRHYRAGGDMIAVFVLPVTISLALRIYRQRKLLLQNILPLATACLSGSVTSVVSVWALCKLFAVDTAIAASLLPKSATTAIAVELSEKAGGFASLTVAAVIVTGASVALLAPFLISLLGLKDPVAIGAALGTSGHALGTTRALEYGETQGAMSGIALTLTGVVTSLLFVFFL